MAHGRDFHWHIVVLRSGQHVCFPIGPLVRAPQRYHEWLPLRRLHCHALGHGSA